MKLVSRKKGKKRDWLDLWYQAIMVEKCGCRGGNSAWPCYTFRTQVLLETIFQAASVRLCVFVTARASVLKQAGGGWEVSQRWAPASVPRSLAAAGPVEKKVRWQKKLKNQSGRSRQSWPRGGWQPDRIHARISNMHVPCMLTRARGLNDSRTVDVCQPDMKDF